VSTPPTLHVSTHPAVQHKLAVLRDEHTEPKKFREVVRELSWLLGYEALADARLRPRTIRTPLEEMEAAELGDRIGLVPILRAGLGMVDGFLRLVPDAAVGHLGMRRNEETLQPEDYYESLPEGIERSTVFIVDPMLATGGSAVAALARLRKAGATDLRLVCLVAAPEGVAAVRQAAPDVPILAAALDRGLDERGYIRPGLGDAGDRLFGTD
jgi:uracil phosphoribosyltransferase